MIIIIILNYVCLDVFPEYVLFTLYNSLGLIVSYICNINYGLLLWGVDSHKLQSLQKKALRFMANTSLSMAYFMCTICLS